MTGIVNAIESFFGGKPKTPAQVPAPAVKQSSELTFARSTTEEDLINAFGNLKVDPSRPLLAIFQNEAIRVVITAIRVANKMMRLEVYVAGIGLDQFKFSRVILTSRGNDYDLELRNIWRTVTPHLMSFTPWLGTGYVNIPTFFRTLEEVNFSWSLE